MDFSRVISRVFLLEVCLFLFSNIELQAQPNENEKGKVTVTVVPCDRLDSVVKIYDSLIEQLGRSFSYNSFDTGWAGCSTCTDAVSKLEAFMQCSTCDSNQKRIISQIASSYKALYTLVTDSSGKSIKKGQTGIQAFSSIYLSLVVLKQNVAAAFHDSVPDNKVLQSNLESRISSSASILQSKLENAIRTSSTNTRDLIYRRIDTMEGDLYAGFRIQRAAYMVGTKILMKEVQGAEYHILDSLTRLIDRKFSPSDIVQDSLPPAVEGISYYSRGVVAGFCNIRASHTSFSVGLEIGDYYRQTNAKSYLGYTPKFGVLWKNYNIGLGFIVFWGKDALVDPEPKADGDVFRHIVVSLDYWTAHGLSLGVGYSVLTGLGGRVLIGL